MSLLDDKDGFQPLFSSVRMLSAVLGDHLDRDEHETVMTLFELGSPWQLLEIFLLDRFHGDFTTRNNLKIPNNEICWHLSAIACALENHTSDLGACYTEKWVTDFHYDGARGVHKGQGKLFFSLLYFCLSVPELNVTEVGGGCGEGGFNHSLVCDVLNELHLPKMFTLIDPLLRESTTIEGECSITRLASIVTADTKFSEPVFCDIYEGMNFGVIQEAIIAPVKMLKCLNPLDVSNILLQPYHSEVRLFKNNQFVNILRAFNVKMPEFDNCSNCIKWKALSLEFGVSSDLLFRHLVRCETYTCTPLVGAGVIRALDKETKRMTDLKRYLNRDNMLLDPVSPDINHRLNVPTQTYTDWDYTVIKFLETQSCAFSELIVPTVTCYSLAVPHLATHDGIKFYHSFRSVSWFSSSMYVLGFTDDLKKVIELATLYGYDLIDRVFNDDRFCHLYVKMCHVEKDIPICLDVSYDTQLPGRVRILRCNDHVDGNGECEGLLCGRGCDNYGVWYFNSYIIPIHYVMSAAISMKTVMHLLYLYHRINYTDDMCEKMLEDLYIHRLYTRVFHDGVASEFAQAVLALYALIGVDCNNAVNGGSISLTYGVLNFGLEPCSCCFPSREIACIRYGEQKVYSFHDIDKLKQFLVHVEVRCLPYVKLSSVEMLIRLDEYTEYIVEEVKRKIVPHIKFKAIGNRSVSPRLGKYRVDGKYRLSRVETRVANMPVQDYKKLVWDFDDEGNYIVKK